MISWLKQFYNREQYNPTIIGLFINPFYIARKSLYKNISKLIIKLEGKILDVGCGSKPYEKICNCTDYIGLELDTPENRNNKKADFFYDGTTFPFSDKSFDSLLSNQVFEHVFNPNEFIKEMNRVIKIDGRLLISVPFVWDEHEQPYDYARYSSFGLKHILNESGFEVIESIKSVNTLGVVFQLLNDYIYKKTVTRSGYINLLFTLLLMAPVNILGVIVSSIFPKNNDLYLDNIILARKVSDV